MIRLVPPRTTASPIDVSDDLRELAGAEVVDLIDGQGVDAGYRLDRPLAAGGMGVAFLAHATDAGDRTGRCAAGVPCVVKVMLPSMVVGDADVAALSFKKEVVALARLSEKVPPSPFVVRWLDAGAMPARYRARDGEPLREVLLPWCAMELVDGRPFGTTLYERLENARAPLEPARAVGLIEGIVRGVRAVHSVGLVHRDLKPSNVLVCGEPPHELPKITDFGVARAVGLGDTFDVTVGTSGYASLEQLEGPAPAARDGRDGRDGRDARDGVGPWSDVFALGAIFYEILTRTPMYETSSAMAFVGKVLARNFVRLATRDDLGEAWHTADGRALAGHWDTLLLRATSPRSPGGGNFAIESMPMRHRDVDELLDELVPLLAATRALGEARPRARAASSVVRGREPNDPSQYRRWSFRLGERLGADEPLVAAAIRPDGGVLAASSTQLWFHGGDRWRAVATPDAARALERDPEPVAVLSGGAGTFVVVRAGGEIEILPGGGGAFSFRLPFAVKAATALAGHPLGEAWLAVYASYGEWVVLRMAGRVASPFVRFGSGTPIAALARTWFAGEESLIVGGSTIDRRGREAFLASVDRAGRVTALPPIPGPSVGALAVDADGELLIAGPGGVGRLDLARGTLALDDVVSLAGEPTSPASSGSSGISRISGIERLVALPDGQAWGFASGLVLRRGGDHVWRKVHEEPACASSPVLAVAASGAHVWAVHRDGRVLAGWLAVGHVGGEDAGREGAE
jgi:serine/threonine protein kinase